MDGKFPEVAPGFLIPVPKIPRLIQIAPSGGFGQIPQESVLLSVVGQDQGHHRPPFADVQHNRWPLHRAGRVCVTSWMQSRNFLC